MYKPLHLAAALPGLFTTCDNNHGGGAFVLWIEVPSLQLFVLIMDQILVRLDGQATHDSRFPHISSLDVLYIAYIYLQHRRYTIRFPRTEPADCPV